MFIGKMLIPPSLTDAATSAPALDCCLILSVFQKAGYGELVSVLYVAL